KQLHFHATLHGREKRVGELLPNLIRPKDVALEQNERLGVVDRLEHGSERGGTVVKQANRVSARHVGSRNPPEAARERRPRGRRQSPRDPSVRKMAYWTGHGRLRIQNVCRGR